MEFLKKYPFYFWLLPVYFLFHNYNNLFGFIPLKEIIVFAIIVYLISAGIYLLFQFVFRTTHLSAIAGFLIVSYNLFFGAIHDFLKSATHDSIVSSYKIIIPISIALLIGVILFLRKRKSLSKLVQYLNSLIILLFLVELVFFIKNAMSYSQTKNLIYRHSPFSNRFMVGSISDTSKPDIYFLVYDEYTNNETLKTVWNYDNSEITDWLQQQGFFIPKRSRANYNFTPFSVSSALNMQYLDSNKGKSGNDPVHMLQAVKSMSHNETISILKKENYHFRFFVPFENKIEDIGVVKEFGDVPAKHLYNTLLLNRMHKDILWNFPENKLTNVIGNFFSYKDYNSIGKRLADTHGTIKKIKSAASSDKNPKFVYAHLMITHAPHIFDSSSQVLQKINWDSLAFFKSYPYQVKYANKTLKELVEFIKTKSMRKTIIIILGDHGFRKLPASMLDYNFPNFCAIYFPDRNYSLLYDTISPVNIFKVVFNTCFRQNFPLSKDSSIAVTYQ